jgi:hypothetical protein
MTVRRLITSVLGLLIATSAWSQPLHQRLLYSHPLTSDESIDGMVLQNNDGQFVENGWQSTNEKSQLFITLPEGLPFEATFEVDVTNFDPYSQSINRKQPIIDLYSDPCGNKDIYETDGAWFHLISGTGYMSGVEGEAGFKLWAAPRGVDSKDESRLMHDARWDINATYRFTFVWTGTNLHLLVNGVEQLVLPFEGQVEAFKYIFLGKDNLIWGYTSQPGPIFSNMRIFGPGLPEPDTTPPSLEWAKSVSATHVKLRFDEALASSSVSDVSHYQFDPPLTVQSAALDGDNQTVLLTTSEQQDGTTYTVTVSGVTDQADTPNAVDNVSAQYTYRTALIGGLTPETYRVVTRSDGDSLYIDRDFVFTSIPTELADSRWILTANDDKYATDTSFIEFYLSRPADVIIGYDNSTDTRPAWLSDWTATGYQIQSSDTHFMCYQKRFEAGKVVLGGNEQGRASSMYLVAVNEIQISGDRQPPSPPSGVVVETQTSPW